MASRPVGFVTPEWPLLPALPLLAWFIAMPAAGAWRRRQHSRRASEAAAELVAFADRVRREQRCLPLDESLRDRLGRLRVPDLASLQLALELQRRHGDADPLADAAQRLALRLRRRVAFERKMLARTAPGLRRGAIAASIPPAVAIGLGLAGVDIPVGTLSLLLAAEMLGCVLLAQWARVEI